MTFLIKGQNLSWYKLAFSVIDICGITLIYITWWADPKYYFHCMEVCKNLKSHFHSNLYFWIMKQLPEEEVYHI